jgi:hypothetical protein
MQTAKFILMTIRRFNDVREPNLEAWADVVRMMRTIDKRTDHEIREAMVLAHEDPFWTINCQSPKALRKHFDRFKAIAVRDKDKGVPLDKYRGKG